MLLVFSLQLFQNRNFGMTGTDQMPSSYPNNSVIALVISIVNIKFLQHPDIKCKNPVIIWISDFIKVA